MRSASAHRPLYSTVLYNIVLCCAVHLSGRPLEHSARENVRAEPSRVLHFISFHFTSIHLASLCCAVCCRERAEDRLHEHPGHILVCECACVCASFIRMCCDD